MPNDSHAILSTVTILITRLSHSPSARLSAMSHRALAAARPKAALDIAEAVLEMAGRETGSRGNTGNIGDPGDWSGVVTA